MPGITFNAQERSDPRWAAQPLTSDKLTPFPIPLVADSFNDSLATKVTMTSTASSSATTLAVSALEYSIPKGAILKFDSGEFAQLTATAAAGATSLTVEAIPNAIESGDIAYYNAYSLVRKTIKSGTVVGRTYAERDAGTGFGPAVYNDDEIFILAFDMQNIIEDNLGVGVLSDRGTVIKENFLPEWTTLNTATDEVVAVAITGTLSGGEFFITYNGNMSNGIAHNANAATIQTAAQGLFGSGDVTVSGTVASFTLTFGSDLAGVDMDAIGIDISALTGGDSATVTVSTQGGKKLLTVLRGLYRMIKGAN